MAGIPEPPPIPYDYAVSCEVALTPEQQRIVKNQTGRDMSVLILEDPDGSVTKAMKSSNPDDFTILAIHQAERLNLYDEEYHEYLVALAAWQDEQNQTDPMDELAEKLEIAAMQEAERIRLFYAKEMEELDNARAVAKIAWGKKE